jgi:hypothetical protein
MTDDYDNVTKPPMRTADGVSLRDYIDLRFSELQRQHDKDDATMTIRLASMNATREAMREQATKFITRAEADLTHKAMCDHIETLREESAENRGKASQKSVLVAYVLSAISLVLGLVSLVKGVKGM